MKLTSKFISAENILSTPEVSWKWVVSVLCVAWISGLYVLHSDFGTEVSSRIHDAYMFRLRDYYQDAPVVSPKLKIYVIDDLAFTRAKTWPIPVERWAEILKQIDNHQPSKIIIDQTFTRYSQLGPDITPALAGLRGIKSKIIVGAFMRERADVDNPLPADTYGMRGDEIFEARNTFMYRRNFQIGRDEEWVGPHADLRDNFKSVGHITYLGLDRIMPFYVSNERFVFPHLGLMVADKLKGRNDSIYANGKKVHLNGAGEITVNLLSQESFVKNLRRLPTGIDIETGAAFKDIARGDVVLILPSFFSGSGDYHYTSMGNVSGGYLVASVANSVLSGKWLKSFPNPDLLALLFCILGCVLAMQLAPPTAFYLTVVAGACCLMASYFAFAWLSLMTPIPAFLVAFMTSSGVLTIRKLFVRDRKTRVLRYAFAGNVPEKRLDSMINRAQSVDVEPRQEVATVMFIDMVGYSVAVEGTVPRRAFERLKEIVDEVTEVIHKYDGVVNKTMGDGVLAVFGLNRTIPTEPVNHALNALKCALEIQQKNVENVMKLSENSQRINLLLRIGLNTGPVFVGNLGKGERIDLTLIGNSVNMAKRLESDCALFRVLVGESTHELVKIASLDHADYRQKFVRIKHHVDMVPAWEYNPFKLNPKLVEHAEAALAENREQIERRKRWQFFRDAKIYVDTTIGKAQLINFSHTGLCLKLENSVTHNQEFELIPESLQLGNTQKLQGHGIGNIILQVKWFYHDEVGVVCGGEIQNLSDKQRNSFIVALCDIHDQMQYGAAG